MDLSGLSDADFAALQSGKLHTLSEAGFAQLLKAQQAALSPEQKAQQGSEIQRARSERELVDGSSTLNRLMTGFGKSFADTGLAAKQAMPGSSVTRQSVDDRNQLIAPIMNTGAAKLGYGAGVVAQAIPAAMMTGGSALGSVLAGGAQGAMSPVGTKDSVAQNALMGAGGAAVGAGVTNALSKTLAPAVSPGARNLIDSGVTLTPGQRLGGAFKRAEDAMTSLPGTGDAIRSAQRKTFEEFNAAVANSALKPIGAKLPAGTTGRDAIQFTETALGRAYDSALARIGTVKADGTFANELQSLRNMVRQSPMPAEVQAQFDKVIQNQITGKLQGQGAMTAQTFKDAESELGRLATKYGADASVDKQLMGDALQEAQAAMRRMLERSAGPDLAGDIKAANTGWAEFKRMQRASTMLGAKDGIFSPENYQNAVKALDRSKDKASFARGDALGQDLGSDAVRVMGSTVPDSGTAMRTIMQNPLQNALMAGITAPVAAAYSRPAQNLLQAVMSGKRPALATRAAAELEMAAPSIGSLGAIGANAFQRSRSQ